MKGLSTFIRDVKQLWENGCMDIFYSSTDNTLFHVNYDMKHLHKHKYHLEQNINRHTTFVTTLYADTNMTIRKIKEMICEKINDMTLILICNNTLFETTLDTKIITIDENETEPDNFFVAFELNEAGQIVALDETEDGDTAYSDMFEKLGTKFTTTNPDELLPSQIASNNIGNNTTTI